MYKYSQDWMSNYDGSGNQAETDGISIQTFAKLPF